jgi:hypothetical protein
MSFPFEEEAKDADGFEKKKPRRPRWLSTVRARANQPRFVAFAVARAPERPTAWRSVDGRTANGRSQSASASAPAATARRASGRHEGSGAVGEAPLVAAFSAFFARRFTGATAAGGRRGRLSHLDPACTIAIGPSFTAARGGVVVVSQARIDRHNLRAGVR